MRVDVRYFAAAREAAARDSESLELPEGATVQMLHDAVRERHPDLGRVAPGMRLAVGTDFVLPERVLHDGEVVALIPPVSGG